MSSRCLEAVKFGGGTLFLGLLLGSLVLGLSPAAVPAEYEPSSTDPPDWYTQTVGDGLLVNGVGSELPRVS